jgi:hypothetical protein
MEGVNSPSNMKETVRNFKNSIEIHIEYIILNAKLTRAKYLALLDEGFTEQQAIELSKGNPII